MALLRHIENKEEVVSGIQHGFAIGKSYLINLLSFCNEVTGLVDKGKVTDVTWSCANNMTLSHMISWPPNQESLNLSGGPLAE